MQFTSSVLLLGCLLVLGSTSAAAAPPSPIAAKVQAAIQQIANDKAKQYQCGFAIAVRGADFATAAAAGEADLKKKIPLTVDSKFVWGSVTKLTTVRNSQVRRAYHS